MLTKATGIWAKNSNIVNIFLQFQITDLHLFVFLYNLVMQSWIFQSSVSRDPSEIILIFWFAVQETLLSMLKTAVLLNIFVETQIFFKILWWIEISKDQHCFVIRIFCNIIIVFNVTFDQFNASLLNKSYFSLFPGKIFYRKLLNCSACKWSCFI